ncbi:MAG: hypothetical protein ACJ8F4_09255 [Sphingomonas sp.]
MTMSCEESAKLLIRRANLLDWIAEARSQLDQREFAQNTIGYRLSLEAVEEQLRQNGVSLDNLDSGNPDL